MKTRSSALIRSPANVFDHPSSKEGVKRGFGQACSSGNRAASRDREGTSDRAREWPRVTGVYCPDKAPRHFAGISAKPSDGLEPSTPSLP
jgi:hypothetical protein